MHRYDWLNQLKNNDNAASTNRKGLLENSFNQQNTAQAGQFSWKVKVSLISNKL